MKSLSLKEPKFLFEVKHLESGYGAMKILKGVSIDVAEREIVVVLGANGAGKSTLLKTISGLLHPMDGEIIFLGKRIDRLSPELIVKRGISLVPEGRRILPYFTVRENLKIGGYIRSDKKRLAEDIEKLLDLFPILRKREKTSGGLLSGGEQQMLAIARALVSKPKLIMMDEPSLGLAPLLVEEIFDLILLMKADENSILLVEQNALEALRVSDRAYLLEMGANVLKGTSKELMVNEYIVNSYLGASTDLSSS